MSDDLNQNSPAGETAQTLALNTAAPAAPTPEAPALNSSEGTQDAAAAGLAPTDDQSTSVTDAAPTADGASDLAVSAAAGLPTAVPAGADLESLMSDADPIVVDPGQFALALRELDAIEQDALFMGGEMGVKIRNAVCKARNHLMVEPSGD